MLGSRSPVSIVASLTVIILSLFSAVIAGAQTPAPAPADSAQVSDTTVKPATESPKAETESVKTETPATIAAATTTTVTAPPPMQQCGRTVKADVVAIPQPIMLNRLGATIPNACVFALKGDTIGSGNNIQLRPGRRPRGLPTPRRGKWCRTDARPVRSRGPKDGSCAARCTGCFYGIPGRI